MLKHCGVICGYDIFLQLIFYLFLCKVFHLCCQPVFCCILSLSITLTLDNIEVFSQQDIINKIVHSLDVLGTISVWS